MIKIPCIEEKCILFPACINKVEITCTDLNKLLTHMEDNMTIDEMWKELREHFPNANYIAASTGDVNTNFNIRNDNPWTRYVMLYEASKMKDESELCKGCSIHNSCKCTPDNNECPCIKCLVKVVCETGCNKFVFFESKSRKKRAKDYEKHLYYQGKVMAK